MITNLSSKKTRTTPKLAMLMKIDLLQFLPRWVTPLLTPVGELCKERATNIKLKLRPELPKSNIDAEEEDFVEGDEEEGSGPHGEEEGWVGSCTLLFGWLVFGWRLSRIHFARKEPRLGVRNLGSSQRSQRSEAKQYKLDGDFLVVAAGKRGRVVRRQMLTKLLLDSFCHPGPQ